MPMIIRKMGRKDNVIEIVRTKNDREREVWEFRLIVESFGTTCRVTLRKYSYQTRMTKRHKWQRQTFYNSQERRYSSIKSAADVPIPPDVEAEAIASVEIIIVREYPR